MVDTALKDILVLEIGSRLSAGICGSVLAQLGATVIVPEFTSEISWHKKLFRSQFMAGKLSVALRHDKAEDRAIVDDLLGRCDLCIASNDVDQSIVGTITQTDRSSIVCDVTAFGNAAPLAKAPYSDVQIQALSGILDTTGLPKGSPTPIPLPVTEIMTGVYAAASCLAALRSKKQGYGGQFIDMALYDCAFLSMATFFPKLLEGSATEVGRVGNCHAMAAPWDAYKAQDGWVLICAASNSQWRIICDVIRRPELAEDPRYLTVADRVNKRPEVDLIVQEWVGKTTIEGVVETLGRVGIPCGPVTKLNQFPREANLEHRQMVRSIRGGSQSESVYVSSSPLKMTRTPGVSPERFPDVDENRGEVRQLIKNRSARGIASSSSNQSKKLPLAGIRVIEIGHYTTAPLSARHLANLGADVIKIEPPDGEAVRGWPPAKKGIGYFFAYTNASKRSLALNLENDEDCKTLKRLLLGSDILIENLKPGALSKRGFSPEKISDLNPRLIYCAVSGFGADSLYAGRPAYDFVIQAMSGFMDITRAEGIPIKAGISFADIMGAEMATVAILAALEARDRLECGQYIDLSMQDVAAWTTQPFWNRSQQRDSYEIFRANDGFVVTDVPNPPTSGLERFPNGSASKAELAKALQMAGYRATPVLTASEALTAPQTHSRNLLSYANDLDGDTWPLLGSPLRLTATPPVLGKPMSVLDGDRNSILNEIKAVG